MKALLYQIHLDEPLLATQPHSEEPNSAVSYSFIPGSMIRGALVRAYLSNKSVPDPAVDPQTRTLFFDGQIRFLNAYPAHPQQRWTRLLPTPLSWHVEKDEVDDWEAPVRDSAAKQREEMDSPEALKRSFTLLSNGTSERLNPKQQVNVHNTSQDRNIKQQGRSQVYKYNALAAGQTFVGVIIADEALTSEQATIQELLPKVKTLGGSATGGYGRVTVAVKDDTKDSWQAWQEYEEDQGVTDRVILTLLSDAILGQEHGNLMTALEDLVGSRPDAVFARERLAGGFNRRWGLPLPQQWALEQGSVFVFENGDADKLKKLVEPGIGRRTIDGFGRVAVNWHGRQTYKSVKLEPRKPEEQKTLQGAGKEVAQQLLRQHLRHRLEQGLIHALDVHTIRLRKLPSATQLSRARVAARHALLQQDLTLISKHLDNLKGAKREWQEARLNNGIALFEWVKEQCALSEKDFTTTFLRGNPLPMLANQEAELTEEVKTEYVARYIDGVLKQAVEQAKAERRGVSHG